MIALRVLNEPGTGSSSGCGGCGSGADAEKKARQDKLLQELGDAVHATRAPKAPPAARGLADQGSVRRELLDDRTVYHLDQNAPLSFVSELSHRMVSGRHLWIGVQEAVVTVLDEGDHELMQQFQRGLSPAAAASGAAENGGNGWRPVSDLIGRLATSGFLADVEGYLERRTAQPERFARFHLTKACQLTCIHCYADSSPRVDRSEELPTERWMRVVEEFAANGGERVLFTGGEALLHAGCPDLMRRSKELNQLVTLFTNGLLVHRFAPLIKATVDQVQVSLDGPDEATNDRIRGRGTYNKILRALDILLAQGTAVRVGMSVMERNWEAWKADFVTFAQRYAGTPLEYRLGFGITKYGRGADLSETLDVSDTQPTVERLLKGAGAGTEGPRITRHTTGCGYCEQFVVGPDGTVYPCHLLDAPVGHIDDRPVAEMTGMLREIARLFDVDHTEGCSTCDIRYLCGGTCRVMNGQRTGSRLLTTCTQADKDRRYRNLVALYSSTDAHA